ncbi:MAG TPA: hypothetical protein VGA36_07045, partial [Nitriliruptorales bacterium]
MTTLLIGTDKGAYALHSDDRDRWEAGKPRFPGWRVTAFGTAPDGTHLAATASNWYGATISRSPDLEAWEEIEDGPAYDAASGRKLKQIWTFHVTGDATVLAGVDEAGLFRSSDNGVSWDPVPGLNDHESRPGWQGGGGGLCAHHVLSDGDRVWVGISSVGLFRSDDGGASFGRFDQGVTPVSTAAEGADMDGWCVHGLVADPADADRIWRQDHMGMYRTINGGESWERIENGLPSGFGFAIRRDHATGRLFNAPIDKPENRTPVDGRFGVYTSDDDGDSWHVAGTGWPDDPGYGIVLRGAMTTDDKDPLGVYVGTTSGEVWG